MIHCIDHHGNEWVNWYRIMNGGCWSKEADVGINWNAVTMVRCVFWELCIWLCMGVVLGMYGCGVRVCIGVALGCVWVWCWGYLVMNFLISDTASKSLTSSAAPVPSKSLLDLPEFFSDLIFFLYGEFSLEDRKLLTRYITAYGG